MPENGSNFRALIHLIIKTNKRDIHLNVTSCDRPCKYRLHFLRNNSRMYVSFNIDGHVATLPETKHTVRL